MVSTVAGYGQPALGLTDHGNMAGTVQLYKHCATAGILPFPGTELYIVKDREDKKAKRHHMCVVAFTTEGYENLVRLNTLANKNFHHKPLLDHADLAECAEMGLLKGIAGTSGCYFGFIAQGVVNDDQSSAALMKTYSGWFDQFYVELQNHNIDHGDGWNDDKLADVLHGLADECGIPVILTQDSHYCDAHDKPAHETLKQLVAFGPDPDDAKFPGDGFHLADTAWFQDHHHEKRFTAGSDGLKNLIESHDLSIRQLDNYSYNIPFTTDDPQRALRKRCTSELLSRDLNKPRYVDRLNHELEIVEDTGMSGYLLLVADVTDWCKENRVFYQARGSASGSILCWLLGITQVDPLKHGLRFERFISRDRTKPPDIDLDVEHHLRPELIEWLETKFSVHQIGTWLTHSLSGDENGGKGSLRVRYFSAANRSGKKIKDWSEVPQEHLQELYKLSDYGACSAYGTHAAGLVVTTNDQEFDRLVPTMKVASSKTYVTQYDMDDIEALGLVKLDVLGLKTLSVLHKCMDFMGRDVFDGLDWIPLDDSKTYSMISSGNTAGVFQLEGWSAKKGVQELKPTKLADIIAAMALFRKATMESGATESYIKRRHKNERIPDRHELLDRHTKDTYGIVVYQEQVISILRDLGMDPDNLTAFLKAIKASNASTGNAAAVISGYRQQILDKAEEQDVTDEDFNWLWSAIEGFAEYGFNKAHATAYGLTAYRCAYLARNYPIPFHAAVLAVAAGTDKETDYVKATRSKKISIRRADVNLSDVTYSVDPKGKSIRKGLLAIKGVGKVAANHIVNKRPEGGYQSLEHFCQCVGSKVSGVKPYVESGDTEVGNFGVLMKVGAFSSLLGDDG